MSKHHSFAQRIVEVFLTGNLSPLLLILSLVAGAVALVGAAAAAFST